MNTQNIANHVALVSQAARKDMATSQWDVVMTDALYAACGAETTEEMAAARALATSSARAQSGSEQ